MSNDAKISKEQKIYEKMIEKDYEATGYCPYCHIKLPINGICGNLFFCTGGK